MKISNYTSFHFNPFLKVDWEELASSESPETISGNFDSAEMFMLHAVASSEAQSVLDSYNEYVGSRDDSMSFNEWFPSYVANTKSPVWPLDPTARPESFMLEVREGLRLAFWVPVLSKLLGRVVD